MAFLVLGPRSARRFRGFRDIRSASQAHCCRFLCEFRGDFSQKVELTIDPNPSARQSQTLVIPVSELSKTLIMRLRCTSEEPGFRSPWMELSRAMFAPPVARNRSHCLAVQIQVSWKCGVETQLDFQNPRCLLRVPARLVVIRHTAEERR